MTKTRTTVKVTVMNVHSLNHGTSRVQLSSTDSELAAVNFQNNTDSVDIILKDMLDEVQVFCCCVIAPSWAWDIAGILLYCPINTWIKSTLQVTATESNMVSGVIIGKNQYWFTPEVHIHFVESVICFLILDNSKMKHYF